LVIGHQLCDGIFIPEGPLPASYPAWDELFGEACIVVEAVVGLDGSVISWHVPIIESDVRNGDARSS
jgi:hypothetical protein